MICGIITGIIIGFIASKIFSGKGKGCLMNFILGLLGGAFGGWLFGILGIQWENGWIGEIGTGVIGAVILLWLWNKMVK